MESRGRRPLSPERQRPAAFEPRKVPVVYYLSRSRHLEHPHFVEVPLSSPEGLHLKDVINHLNMVRGKGMAAMYSWSCKRSYKNGFVWHDLTEDDLILPATGGEYVLKGSELLNQSPSDQLHRGNGNKRQQSSRLLPQKEVANLSLPREASCSYSPPPPTVIVREAKPRSSPSPSPRQEEESPLRCRSGSSDNISPELEHRRPLLLGTGSTSPAEYRVYKPTGSVDAATQTEDIGRRPVRQSPAIHCKILNDDHGSVVHELIDYRQSHPRQSGEWQGIAREVRSQCPTPLNVPTARGRSESLESLIRADANTTTNSFRIFEEDDIVVPTCPKLRPTNVLMQLITCGSVSVKSDNNLGLTKAYKPRFSNLKFPSPLISRTMMMGELDYLSENPRLIGLRLEDKEYFSGSLIETTMHREVAGERYPMLKRSSSYDAERSVEPLDCARPEEDTVDTSRSRCLPRTAILTSLLHPKSETPKCAISDCRRSSSAGPDCSLASGEESQRFTDALGSFRKDNEKLVRIEERLPSGARVVIQSTVPSDDIGEGLT